VRADLDSTGTRSLLTSLGTDLLSTTYPFPTFPYISSTQILPPSRDPYLFPSPPSTQCHDRSHSHHLRLPLNLSFPVTPERSDHLNLSFPVTPEDPSFHPINTVSSFTSFHLINTVSGFTSFHLINTVSGFTSFHLINTVSGRHEILLRSNYTPHLTSNASTPAHFCPPYVPLFDSNFSSAACALLPSSVACVNASCACTHSRTSSPPT
jgi:hypothetical protein